MFDYHMHSTVSFDGHDTPEQMLAAARAAGLREICFTDHMDHDPLRDSACFQFTVADYEEAYSHLCAPDLKLRLGMEFGMLPQNRDLAAQSARGREYDFIIGSVHFAEDLDVYYPPYWEGKTVLEAERVYLQTTLDCVQAHEDFDVLGHLTYLSKARSHPTHAPIILDNHRDLVAEIMKVLIRKGKGMEINTSGVDRCGAYLPAAEYLRLFKDLGGKIVTVGSDAHTAGRVGQYCFDACAIVKEIFGYVCTFEKREPIFHK